MATNIFSKFFWSKRRIIIASSLAGVSVVAIAVAVPVALTRPKNNDAKGPVTPPVTEVPTPDPGDGTPGTGPTGPGNLPTDPPVEPTDPENPPTEPVVPDKQLLIVAAGESNMQGITSLDPGNKNSYLYSAATPVIYTGFKDGAAYDTADNTGASITGSPVQLKSAGDGLGGYSIVKGIAFKQAASRTYGKIWVVNSAVAKAGFKTTESPIGHPTNLTSLGRAYEIGMLQQGLELNTDLKSALLLGKVEVVVTWLQGESDVGFVKTETEADQYADMVASYLETIRELLPVTAQTVVPIVVGAMEPTWTSNEEEGSTVSQRQLVQQAISTIPGKLEYSAYANSNNLPVNSHEGADYNYGLSQLGAMADRFIAAIPVAKDNDATYRLPIRSLDNRIFSQFTNSQASYWPDAFDSSSAHTAFSFNRNLGNSSSGYSTSANFSNLGKLYTYKSGDADLNKRYRFRLRLYANIKFSPYIEINFVQSVNPLFYSNYVSLVNPAYFEIESLRIAGTGTPAFTKDNVDLGVMRSVGSAPSSWYAGSLKSVLTMNSGQTDVPFAVGGASNTTLGKLASKDGKLSWSFSQITLDAIIPGM